MAEGDANVRMDAQRGLTQQGYFVVPAADGAEALAHMQNGSLDVVVAQVSLPKHDGLEILRAAQEKKHPLPVILLADTDSIAEAANGVREGAFDYLVKPLDDLTRLAIMIERAAGQVPTPQRATPTPQPAQSPIESKAAGLLPSLTAGHDLNSILEQFTTEFARLARATHTFVLLPHNDGQLHLTASHGFTTRVEAGRSYTNRIGETFALRVATAKNFKWLNKRASETT